MNYAYFAIEKSVMHLWQLKPCKYTGFNSDKTWILNGEARKLRDGNQRSREYFGLGNIIKHRNRQYIKVIFSVFTPAWSSFSQEELFYGGSCHQNYLDLSA